MENNINTVPVIDVSNNKSPFSEWGFGLGVISLLLVMTYFLMFFGMMLSPLGIIFSVINFVYGVRKSNSKKIHSEVVFSIIGFLLSSWVFASAIYYVIYHPPMG